jgi:hypothetical protein
MKATTEKGMRAALKAGGGRLLALGLLLGAGLGACGEGPAVQRASVPCSGGELLDGDLGALCVYEGPITETRFQCPPELPYLQELSPELRVCTSGQVPRGDLERELERYGYGIEPNPNSVEPDPNNIEPDPENNVGPDPENNVGPDPENNVGPDPNNQGQPRCEEGSQAVCACPDESPGAQTCEGGVWGGCACQEAWTLPGVNEAQPAPVDCAEPAQALQAPVDLSNTEALGEPCLEEWVLDACPVVRTHFRRDEAARPTLERQEIANEPAFRRLQGSSFWLYGVYGPYERLWSYDDARRTAVETRDQELDGTINQRETSAFDEAGRVVRRDTEYDGASSYQTWTYDEEGRVTRNESGYTTDAQSDVYITTTSYQEGDTVLEQVTTRNGERTAWVLKTFDEAGRLEESDVRTFDGLGEETRYFYREDDTLERSRTRESATGIEENGREFRYLSAIVERTYDARGNELRAVTDYSGNGTSFTEIVQTWDERDRLLTQSYGTVGEEVEASWTYTYAPDGGPLERVVKREALRGADRLITYHYAPHGGTTLTEWRVEGSERVEMSVATTYTEAGEPLLTEHDYDGDGVINQRQVWVRDAGGNLYERYTQDEERGFLRERFLYRYECGE